jgi:hypothetical protein
MTEIFTLVGRIAMDGYTTVESNLNALQKLAIKSGNELNAMGRQMERAGSKLVGLTAPIAALAAGIGALAIKTGDYAEHLTILNSKTGLTTDTLQEMKHIAVQTGVDFNLFAESITKLTRQIPGIEKGTGPASEALKRMGLNVHDSSGKLKNMNVMFPEIINKLQGVEDVTERVALSQQIFGKGAADLAPILGLTAGQFAAMRKEAHSMGLVMDKEAVESAAKFEEQTKTLKEQLESMGQKIATSVIPILTGTLIPLIKEKLVPAFKNIMDKIKGVADWFNKLSPGVKDMVFQIGAAVLIAGPMLLAFGKILTMVKTLTATITILNAVMIANPVGAVITACAVLAWALYTLYKNWDAIKISLVGIWNTIIKALDDTAAYYTTLIWKFIISSLEAINQVTKYIPGLNTAVDSLIDAAKRQRDADLSAWQARNKLRLETELAAKQTKDLTVIVGQAAAATENHTKVTRIQTEEEKKAAKARLERLKIEKEENQKSYQEKEKFEDDWAAKERSATLSEKDLLEWEYKEALSIAHEKGASTVDIELYYQIQRLNLAKKEKDKKNELDRKESDEKKRILKEEFQMGKGMVDQLFSILGKNSENKMALVDQETAQQIAAINASTMSEKDKQATIEKINAEADTKKRKLAREQAVRNKESGIFNTIISTAEAIMKAWTLGPIAGIVFSVIAAALGVAEIAVIASTPLPALASGAYVPSQPGGIQATIGEGSQAELVLPMETGLKSLIKGVSDAVLHTGNPGSAAGSAGTSATAGQSQTTAMHLHVGTLIADDSGMKNLERTLLKFRVAEAQRKGQA